MRFCILRSGSSANCTYVEHDDTRLLIDAGGMSQRGLSSVLSEINADFAALKAVVVTHLHSDHFNQNTLHLCRAHGVPVYVHESNLPVLRALMKKHACGVQAQPFSEAGFAVGPIVFSPFLVDHDANNATCGFTFCPQKGRSPCVAFATDLGCFPDSLVPLFAGSGYVVLESNHDTGLLWKNPRRPLYHKQRVASDSGHLSNEQAGAALVRICAASRKLPEAIVLSHLSADHNSPEMAVSHVGAMLKAGGYSPRLYAAFREKKTVFFEC